MTKFQTLVAAAALFAGVSAYGYVPCSDVIYCAHYRTNSYGNTVTCDPNPSGSPPACSPAYCCIVTPPPPPPPPPSTGSFVTCNTKVQCAEGFKTDPKTGGIMRCKPRAGTSKPCTQDFCCKSSSFVLCNTKVSCPGGYNTDPKVGGMRRCKTWAGTTQPCNNAYCCKPYAPQPQANIPCNKYVSCHKYYTSPYNGQVATCDYLIPGSPSPCNTLNCCEY